MTTDTYTGPFGGDWFDPANWSDGSVPSPGQTVDVFAPLVTSSGTGEGVDATSGTVAGNLIDLSGLYGDYYQAGSGVIYPFAPNLIAVASGPAPHR